MNQPHDGIGGHTMTARQRAAYAQVMAMYPGLPLYAPVTYTPAPRGAGTSQGLAEQRAQDVADEAAEFAADGR